MTIAAPDVNTNKTKKRHRRANLCSDPPPPNGMDFFVESNGSTAKNVALCRTYSKAGIILMAHLHMYIKTHQFSRIK